MLTRTLSLVPHMMNSFSCRLMNADRSGHILLLPQHYNTISTANASSDTTKYIMLSYYFDCISIQRNVFAFSQNNKRPLNNEKQECTFHFRSISGFVQWRGVQTKHDLTAFSQLLCKLPPSMIGTKPLVWLKSYAQTIKEHLPAVGPSVSLTCSFLESVATGEHADKAVACGSL